MLIRLIRPSDDRCGSQGAGIFCERMSTLKPSLRFSTSPQTPSQQVTDWKKAHKNRVMENAPALSIKTRRFLLREYLTTDETDFVRYQIDPSFTVHHSVEELGEDHARSVFQLFMAWRNENPRLNYQFAVCHLADDNRLIGSCGVRKDSHEMDKADFGIELARPYWGRHGFAIEVSSALINWAFSQLSLTVLTADTALSNTVVARLAERAGFERVVAKEKQFWRLERERWKSLRNLKV